MYLHCHACGWEQDDYWSKDYNPLRRILEPWEERLLEQPDLDAPANHAQTYREVIAQAAINAAESIRRMRYRTREEYHAKNPERRCPQCGEQQLDED